MFIDETYFWGVIHIGTSNDAVLEQLNKYINAYEKLYLIEALGVSLYNEFINGLSQPIPDAKWLELRDGADYSYTDIFGNLVLAHWKGLQNSDKINFCADFIYYEFLKDNFQNFNNSFNVSINENTKQADPSGRLVSAHNEGVKNMGLISKEYIYLMNISEKINFITDNGGNVNYINSLANRSLFNFITAKNKETQGTYPNFAFNQKELKNSFGI